MMSLTLWIVYLSMITLFLGLGLSILKRGPSKRINQMFFLFLLSNAVGLACNIFYRSTETIIPGIEIIGNKTTIFLVDISLMFLLLFNLIIWKSDKIITDKIKSVLIIGWMLLCSILFLIPNGVEFIGGVPAWNLPFFLHGVILTQFLLGTVIFVNLQIYKRFENKELKNKYRRSILGVVLFDWLVIGNYLANFLNNPIFRDIFTYTALVSVPAGILLYLGVKRET
ncbi:MAG: hypothetical protein ACTSWY_05085 [Promethearchaeota archaeon]